MAMAQDPQMNGAGLGQKVVDCDQADLEQEKPPFELVYVTENKLKYLNNYFKKVHAQMYDHKCDVRLTVGSATFRGHRQVLADASDYFSAMFTHKMKEQDEYTIDIKEISPNGFTAMLDYFYHGHVNVDQETVPDILEAGRFFHVDWILDVCCDYLVRHLSILDFPLVMHLADKFSLGDLRWDIFKFLGQNLPTLLDRRGFYYDLCEEMLMQFLMEGPYVEMTEMQLIEIVQKWVDTKKDERKNSLVPLLRQIRFNAMDLEELEDLPPDVAQNKELKAEIEDAKSHCLDIACQCLRKDEKYLARGSRTSIFVASFNEVEEHNIVVYIDPYEEQSNLFVEQLGHSGLGVQHSHTKHAKIGNFLFAAGGYEFNFESSARVFRYHTKNREWTEMAMMKQARCSHAMCNSDDHLYVVGGIFNPAGPDSEDQILSSVEMYCPAENEWKSLPDLPHAVFDSAAAYASNTLFVSGGISGNHSHPLPLGFLHGLTDGATEWSTLPEMLEARQSHTLTALNNKLYAIGGRTMGASPEEGFEFCKTNEVYDIETKQWSSLAPVPDNCSHLFRNVAPLDNTIYYLCNRDSETFLGRYDVEKNEFDEKLVLVGEGQLTLAVLDIPYPITS